MERSTATVLATDVRQLREKASKLKRSKTMLSRRLSSLDKSLSIIQWACCEAQNQPETTLQDVENWLRELRGAILYADDSLDMIKHGQLPTKTLLPALVGRDFFFSIPMVLHFAADCRLKRSVKAFDKIAEKARGFCKEDPSQVDAAPAVTPATYYGREGDKEDLIEKMNHGDRLAVIPIVGMAGIGKSTFARFIYNDQRWRFDVRMLIDRNHSTGAAAHRRALRSGHHLPHSELKTARSLIEGEAQQQHVELALTGGNANPSFRRTGEDKDPFQSELDVIKESLKGVRFLLVLLGINNIARRDLFDRLMAALNQIAQRGSTVILTTTNTEFAQSRPSSCSLDRLSRSESWRLFKEHASLPHLPDKFSFGTPRIVDECDGHPLSVIIMAKKMRHRPDALQPSMFFHSNNHQASSVSPAHLPRLSAELKLMYERLMYHDERSLPLEKLHDCFAFLSLFSEDHHFFREELVDLWAAENSMSLDEANGYFETFIREGAFLLCEPLGENNHESLHRRVQYRMRELLPYYAQHVSSKNVHLALSPDSFSLRQLHPEDSPPICQHLSFVCDSESSELLSDVLFQDKPWLLRTLLLLSESPNKKCRVRNIADLEKFKSLRFLRVLHVRGVTFGNLLDGVVKHSNLVYLNVSQSDIEELPKSLGELGNLKILKLSHCMKLLKLPRSVVRLLHLVKLDLEGCALLAKKSLDRVTKLFRLEYLNLSQIDFKSLPQSIGSLRRLKTLILAHCPKIQRLPKSIRKLMHLEKLDLEGCHFLQEIPESPESVMKNLKHLNTLHCPSLTRMPSGLGRLPSLQNLSRYIASEELGRSIVELEKLDLEGGLLLDKLNKLADTEVAKQVELEKKEKLSALTLSWEWRDSDAEVDHSAETTAKPVVEALRPNSKLTSLKLIRYTAKHLPSWMTDEQPYLTSLVDIGLFNLNRCERLPPLGELPHLKVVEISGMDAVTELNDSFYGRTGTFASLERLTLSQMPNLMRWSMPEDDVHDKNPPFHGKRVRNNMFPKLTRLTFFRCPKLEAPSCSLPSIRTLTMWLNNEMLYRSAGGLQSMAPNVKNLSVSLCQDLWPSSRTCEGFWGLTSLEELEISACDSLTCLPEGIKQLTSLQRLSIVCCSNMNSLPDWLNNLTSLQSLSFSACPKLRWRPTRPLRGNLTLRVSVEGRFPLLRYY